MFEDKNVVFSSRVNLDTLLSMSFNNPFDDIVISTFRVSRSILKHLI